MSDENQFFVRRGEKIHGPFSTEQIKSGLRSGTLKSTDRVCQSKSGPWQTVTDLLRAPSPKEELGILKAVPADDAHPLDNLEIPAVVTPIAQTPLIGDPNSYVAEPSSSSARLPNYYAPQGYRKKTTEESDNSSHWPITLGIASGTLILGLFMGVMIGFALSGSSRKNVAALDSTANPTTIEQSPVNSSRNLTSSTGKINQDGDPKAEFIALLKDNSQNKKYISLGRGHMVLKNTLTYDINKTSSLVAPYSAIITFGAMSDQDMEDLKGSNPRQASETEATGKMPLNFSGYYRGYFEYRGGDWVFTGGHRKPHITNLPWSEVTLQPEINEYMNNIISQVITIPNR